ncbi:cadherin-related family member 5 [Cricetulus griseus]
MRRCLAGAKVAKAGTVPALEQGSWTLLPADSRRHGGSGPPVASPAAAIDHSAVWPTSRDLCPEPRYVLDRGRMGRQQSWGGRHQLLLYNFLACSVTSEYFEIKENTNVSEPLANISVPNGQQVSLGSSSTPSAFKIAGDQLFLTAIPDYEVTVLRVFVVVQDVNDNAPEFPFTIKKHDVAEVSPVEPEQVPPEYGGVSGGHRQGDFYTEATAWLDQLLLHPQDTRVGSIVIPGTELEAKDADKDDTLIYTLQEVTPVSASPVPTHYRPLPSDASRPQSLHLPESQVVPSPPLSGRQQLLLPGGAKQPCSEAGEDPGFLQDSEHDPQAAGTGNTDDTFIINADSGNLTMAKSIPRPMTFTLVVRADQVDMARYSITQAIVDARNATGTPLQFSRNRYHGTVVLGSKAGTEVKDRTSPSEILRIQAQYPGFPDLDSATTYQITNSSDFKMEEDVMLTTVAMEHVDTFYVEVEWGIRGPKNNYHSSASHTQWGLNTDPQARNLSANGPYYKNNYHSSASHTQWGLNTDSQARNLSANGPYYKNNYHSSASHTQWGLNTDSQARNLSANGPYYKNNYHSSASHTQWGLNTDSQARNLSANGPYYKNNYHSSASHTQWGLNTDSQARNLSANGPYYKNNYHSSASHTQWGLNTDSQARNLSANGPYYKNNYHSSASHTQWGLNTDSQARNLSANGPYYKNNYHSSASHTQWGLNTDSQARNLSANGPYYKNNYHSSASHTQWGLNTDPQTRNLSADSLCAHQESLTLREVLGSVPAVSGQVMVSWTGTQGEDQRFSTVDMAVLGGVLGALLLLALICLCILIHKHYRHRFNCCSGKVSKPPPPPLSVYDNLAFFPDHKASWLSTSNPQPQPDPETARPPSGPQSPMSSSLTPPSSAPPSPELRAPGSPKTVQAGDSPLAVRSILTKERRPEGEGGYKAVWFGKDIREEADVVVLNEPAAGVDSASASGSEGSDEDSPNQSYI